MRSDCSTHHIDDVAERIAPLSASPDLGGGSRSRLDLAPVRKTDDHRMTGASRDTNLDGRIEIPRPTAVGQRYAVREHDVIREDKGDVRLRAFDHEEISKSGHSRSRRASNTALKPVRLPYT